MLDLLKSNGLRLTLTLTGVLLFTAFIFGAGVNWAKIEGHVSDSAVHQDVEAKQDLVDKRVMLLLGDKLDAIDRRLKAIEKKLP